MEEASLAGGVRGRVVVPRLIGAFGLNWSAGRGRFASTAAPMPTQMPAASMGVANAIGVAGLGWLPSVRGLYDLARDGWDGDRVSCCRKLPEKRSFKVLLPFIIGISARQIRDIAAISGASCQQNPGLMAAIGVNEHFTTHFPQHDNVGGSHIEHSFRSM
jgi:hypothetical protein